MHRLRRAAARAAGAVGLRVDSVGEGAVVVRRRDAATDVRVLGPRVSVLTNGAGPAGLQQRLGHFLAEQEVDWVLRALDVNCVIDGGANRGQFAERIRAGGYTGRIVSFEPLAELVEVLERRAAADPDWHVHACALGDGDGTATINVVPGTMSSVLPVSDFGRSWHERLRGASTRQTVRVRRLADVFDEIVDGIAEPRVFLKLDTQGYDLLAFRGVGERIGEVCAMMSEVSAVPIYDGMPRFLEQVAEYEAAGFELAGMYPVTLHRETLRVIEFDAVLVRSTD